MGIYKTTLAEINRSKSDQSALKNGIQKHRESDESSESKEMIRAAYFPIYSFITSFSTHSSDSSDSWCLFL